VKFLIDAQLPPLLADWLREQGHEAHHLLALDMLGADDGLIWSLAVEQDYVVITKDRDFATWAIARKPAARVVWLRFGNLRNHGLVRRLSAAWPRVVEGLQSDAAVIEAR
jgi:predicted nuclease of predicted toxin-antitoxin system